MSVLPGFLASFLGGVPVPTFIDATGRIDHIAKAISRLPEELKNSAQYISLLNAFLSPLQEIEEMFFALLALKSIDDAEGAVLDLIGKLVGQPRDGSDDPEYRGLIRVRLAVNLSRGQRRDYLKVVSLLYPTAKIEVRGSQGTCEVTVHGVIIDVGAAAILMSLLQLTHGAGARAVLGTFPQSADSTFTYRAAASLAANTLIGAISFTFPTSLDVQSFPATGFAKFMTTGEVTAYERNATFTALNVLAPGLVQAHTAGEIVEQCTAGGVVLFPEFTAARGYNQGKFASGLESIDQ